MAWQALEELHGKLAKDIASARMSAVRAHEREVMQAELENELASRQTRREMGLR